MTESVADLYVLAVWGDVRLIHRNGPDLHSWLDEEVRERGLPGYLLVGSEDELRAKAAQENAAPQ
ncbi:MAG: hypothetical protein ACRDQZ_18995 [Mycobacteriales bacterium]